MIQKNLIKEKYEADEVVLTHGTSVEAACALLEKERLMIEPFSERPDRACPSYLYFTINGSHFKDHPFLQKGLEINTFEDAIECSRVSGKVNGREHFLVSQSGYYSEHLVSLPFTDDPEERFPKHKGPWYEIEALLDFVQEMKAKKGFSYKESWELCEEANKRQGVILACGKNIFDLALEPPVDETTEVRIYLPTGLDIRYIKSIMPLGEIERKVLLSL